MPTDPNSLTLDYPFETLTIVLGRCCCPACGCTNFFDFPETAPPLFFRCLDCRSVIQLPTKAGGSPAMAEGDAPADRLADGGLLNDVIAT
jgi:hypothetical protein